MADHEAAFEVWETPEHRSVAEIRARLDSIRSDGDLAPVQLPGLWVAESSDGRADLVYGDGDGCATVSGNLVYGHEATALARFFACAPDDIEWLLDRLEERGGRDPWDSRDS